LGNRVLKVRSQPLIAMKHRSRFLTRRHGPRTSTLLGKTSSPYSPRSSPPRWTGPRRYGADAKADNPKPAYSHTGRCCVSVIRSFSSPPIPPRPSRFRPPQLHWHTQQPSPLPSSGRCCRPRRRRSLARRRRKSRPSRTFWRGWTIASLTTTLPPCKKFHGQPLMQ